jgi:hypothetical protein
VWCYGKVITWTVDGQETRMPAADTPNAARQLASLAATTPS